eukprot:sb/3461366/
MTDHWDPERPPIAPVAAWKPEEKPKRTWQNHKIVDRSLRLSGQCSDHSSRAVLEKRESGQANALTGDQMAMDLNSSYFLSLAGLGLARRTNGTDRADDWFKEARGWITDSFTWLYVGSQDVWALVIIVIYFSKYGNMKLGKDDEEPEYNDASWFSMLFACGVGVGLIFWGVAEPILHYIGLNRYKADKYMPDNELAQHAINLTFFHWGIHGWIVYVVVGLILGFISFRKGLPMTMKSCFYPLIGDRIYGWIGDTIDIFSIITTLFGVCTSLGLGVKSISAGLNYLNEDIADDTTTQVITIWCITCVATISTASGVGMGIRRLSEICFALGMFLMTLVLLLEDTWYILNVFTQSIGFYIQWIIQLGFHCDAFAMEGPSYGGKAVEGDGAYRNADRLRAYEDGMSDGNANWMDWWTIFYWGWWISWSPFVGMFIAQISRGRTIRQFINGTMTAPCLYSIIWFSIFGGAAILEERVSASPANGLCCASWNTTITSAQIQADNLVGYQSTNFTDWLDLDFCANDKGCGDCEYSWMEAYSEGNNYTKTFGDFFSYVSARRYRYGMYNEDYTHVRLSCLSTESKWFALMGKYGGLSGFLSVVSLLSIILYFITSSDSGSLIIDILAANGIEEPPRPQRIFWALCEGATATALLVAGSGEGKDGLSALQVLLGLVDLLVSFCGHVHRPDLKRTNHQNLATQFINGTMTAPCLYSIIWFSIFGGAAILEERVSASPANGLCCASWNTTITSAQIQADNLVGYQSTNFTDWLDLDFCANDKGCGDCEYSWMEAYSEGNNYTKTFGDFFSYVSARRYRYGMYNEDYTHVRLSCLSTESKWFALMGKYGGLSGFLSVVSLLSIILYFITSSDSGSLIIDILAANGIEEPPRPQRIFWALCEGATATALLVAGSGEGKDGLSALQTVSILTGLPYTIILCFLCIALWRGLAMEMGDIDPYGADFKYSVIDPFSTINPKLWVLTLKNIVIAPYTIYKSLFAMGSGNGNAIFMGIASFICWTLWIVLLIAEVSVEGSYAVAWTFYIAFATCITITRHTTRMRYNMNGNPAEDFFCALILYPCTMAQIEAAQTAAGVESLMKLPEEEAVVYQNKAAEAEDTRF